MPPLPSEPKIAINGVALSEGQAMTVRVAVSSLLMDMHSKGLGSDDTGQGIAAGYHARCLEVLKLMYAPSVSASTGGTRFVQHTDSCAKTFHDRRDGGGEMAKCTDNCGASTGGEEPKVCPECGGKNGVC